MPSMNYMKLSVQKISGILLSYAILCWWEDCTDDEDDLIINPMSY